MKGNRQGSLSRSITRRSDQNCKIILQILILQFCSQLVKKVLLDFFDKLTGRHGIHAARFLVVSLLQVQRKILNYYVGNGLDHSAVGISVIVSACTAERPMPMHTHKNRAFGKPEGADFIML